MKTRPKRLINRLLRGNILLLLLLAGYSFGQVLTPLVDTVTVRDGKKIPVDVYVPGPGTWPVILIQTPYNRMAFRAGLPLDVGIALGSSPYAFVVADWRGFYGAISAAVPGYDRGLDGYDVIQWITAQSFSNGRVATWGPSALGKIQFETARHHPPGMVAMVPIVAGTQMQYEDYYPGGAYRKEYVEQLDALGYGLSTIIEAHPLKDVFWRYADTLYMYPEKINTPSLMIGGWYDHNIENMLFLFDSLRLHGPISNRDSVYLIMGPWAHGGHGTAYVGSASQGSLTFPVAENWPDSMANIFLDHYLRNVSSTWLTQPRVWTYQMGDHTWSGFPYLDREPVDSLVLYGIQSDSLGMGVSGPPDIASFISDPRNPSPTIGGPTLRADLLQGPYDQSRVISGGNGLVLQTAPFSSPVEMMGNVQVIIPFTSTTPDADLCIRLADVDPSDDSAYLLLDGVQRLRFRNGYTTMNDTLVPGSPYEVRITLPYTAHTFVPGHRMQLIITGSNYPRFDLNLQNSGPLYTAGDTLTSTISITVNTMAGLRVTLPLRSTFTGLFPENDTPGEICIYPNPGTGRFNILWGPEDPIEIVRLISTEGRQLVLPWELHGGEIEFNATGIPSGMYVAQVQTMSGDIRYGRLVLQ